jgi:acetyl esterase/lipase
MLFDKIQLWQDKPDVILQAYILADSPENADGRPRPAVLILPGGSYLGLSEREAEPVAMRFAAFGYHSFVLRYSTYNFGSLEGMSNPGSIRVNPNAAYPGPLLDLGKAMQTIRANASRWLVDPDKVAICGFSAGGHLASSLGVHWPEPLLPDWLGGQNQDFRPAGLILCYPLIDYLIMKKSEESIRESNPRLVDLWHYTNLAVFGKPEPSHEELARLSTDRFVSAQTPPTFIWHTAEDGLVPVANSLQFAGELAIRGVPCELHVFEKGGHGLSLADAATAVAPEQVNEQAQQWFPLALAWLKRHLPLAAFAACGICCLPHLLLAAFAACGICCLPHLLLAAFAA